MVRNIKIALALAALTFTFGLQPIGVRTRQHEA